MTLGAADTELALALIFGFGLIMLSLIDKKHEIWGLLAGFVWITISVVVFYDYGLLWLVIGVGIGLYLILIAAKEAAEGVGA